MSVNLSAQFTKEERHLNGLLGIEKQLIDDPRARRLIVAEVDTKFIKEEIDEGIRTPTVRLVHIEPLSGEAAEDARRLLNEAYKDRTDNGTLPFDEAEDGA